MVAKMACPAVFLMAGSAGLAQGPYIEPQVLCTFEVVEVDVATKLPVPFPNGVIGPGEAAELRLSVSFTPPVGTVVQRPPSWPGPGTFTMHALNGLLIDLVGEAGTWEGLSLAPGWGDIAGTSNAAGDRVFNIRPHQFAPAGDRSNPIFDLWRGTWTPASYADRSVFFMVSGPDPLGPHGAVWWELSDPPPQYVATGGSAFTAFQVHISSTPFCYPNCDDSTAAPHLSIADFTCFLTRFAAGDPYANCDQSTGSPVLNVADFTCFLQRFAAGCP